MEGTDGRDRWKGPMGADGGDRRRANRAANEPELGNEGSAFRARQTGEGEATGREMTQRRWATPAAVVVAVVVAVAAAAAVLAVRVFK